MSVGTGSQIKGIESKLPRFEGRCLRQIIGIKRQDWISSKEMAERTGIAKLV